MPDTNMPAGGKIKLKDILFLHAVLFLFAALGVFQKLSAIKLEACGNIIDFHQRDFILALVYFGVTALLLVVYALLWQIVLKRMPLSFAYTNKGICTLWTVLLGMAVFSESITIGKAIGIVIVLAGVYLVVSEHE